LPQQQQQHTQVNIIVNKSVPSEMHMIIISLVENFIGSTEMTPFARSSHSGYQIGGNLVQNISFGILFISMTVLYSSPHTFIAENAVNLA